MGKKYLLIPKDVWGLTLTLAFTNFGPDFSTFGPDYFDKLVILVRTTFSVGVGCSKFVFGVGF